MSAHTEFLYTAQQILDICMTTIKHNTDLLKNYKTVVRVAQAVTNGCEPAGPSALQKPSK